MALSGLYSSVFDVTLEEIIIVRLTRNIPEQTEL